MFEKSNTDFSIQASAIPHISFSYLDKQWIKNNHVTEIEYKK